MGTASCVFVVRARGRTAEGLIEARARALARFYAPVELGDVRCVRLPALGAWVGRIGSGAPPAGSVAWGAPFGARAGGREDVFAADDELRREVVGIGAAVGWDAGAARVVTAPSGPVALYAAQGTDAEAWATHAVAAAFLARGAAEVDPEAVPELVGYDFVGTSRSLVRHVRPVPPATRIDLAPDGVTQRSYWPPHERWAPIPEEDADAHTAAALLETLERRVGAKRVGLGLTAGADSRVLAVALRELGATAAAFCWGEDGWPDVEGARAVAAALDLPFTCGATWRPDEALRAALDADARWSDGGLVLSPSRREWPAAAEAIVLGAAGEVGRAFYYRRHANGGTPATRELRSLLRAERRLPGATPEAHALADASVAAWLDAAAASGRTGWRLLDVVYAEQRVACWGRIQVPALDADFVGGFAPQEVVRGLSSLPLGDRVSDGFHRRFVADRRPELALPAPAPPARPDGRVRRRARRLWRRLAGATPPAGDPLLRELWSARPATRAWVADEVLRSPLVAGVLGDGWADATCAGFLAGRRRATEQALVACGPVALDAALRDLRDA